MTRMSTAEQVRKKLDALWLKYLPTLRARLDSIQGALDAMKRGDLTDPERERAAHDAHKLAGSLGTFGILNGSEAAQELERRLLDPKNAFTELAGLFASLKQEIDNRPC